jgi:peroxiredoxin
MIRKINLVLSGICICGSFVFFSCSDSGNTVIEGTFSIADSTPVELYQLTEKEAIKIDSVYSTQGKFKIKTNLNYTQLFLIKYFNGQSIYLAVNSGDHIKLTIDNSMPEISYYVENSTDSKRIKELIDQQNIVLKQIDQISNTWLLNHIDTSARFELDQRYQSLLLNHREFTRKFIYADPTSLANILALYQNFGRKSQPLFDRYDDLKLFNYVDSNLVALYAETDAVKALNREVTETKEQIAHKKFIDKTVTEGRPLPPLMELDINGDTIVADGTQNRPVLLFFWASWNPYSTGELLALNSFHTTPDGKKIDVITISLDTSEEKLREFIAKNKIDLPVLCDYQYWDSELAGRYAIKQIPSNILADKDGFVKSKNLFSYELINNINQIIR